MIAEQYFRVSYFRGFFFIFIFSLAKKQNKYKIMFFKVKKMLILSYCISLSQNWLNNQLPEKIVYVYISWDINFGKCPRKLDGGMQQQRKSMTLHHAFKTFLRPKGKIVCTQKEALPIEYFTFLFTSCPLNHH